MRIFDHAKRYHQISRYTFNDIKNIYREMTYESKHVPVKDYQQKAFIPLEKTFPRRGSHLSDDFQTSSQFSLFMELKSDSVSLFQISQLLYLTNGVTQIKDFAAKKIYLRAAPSAGACYPIEIYLVVDNIEGLNKGLYYYHPLHHGLFLIEKGEVKKELYKHVFELDFVQNAPFFLLFSNVYSRNEWKYQKRALRYGMLDCGYIVQNLHLAASSLGWAVNALGDFKDQEINHFLNFDSNEEVALMIAAVGTPEKPLEAASYSFGMPGTEINHGTFSTEPQRYYYAKSSHMSPGEKGITVNVKLPFKKIPAAKEPVNELINLPDPNRKLTHSTFQTIGKRRSVHNFQRISMPLTDLSTLLHFLKKIPAMYNFPAFHTYLAVSDIDQLVNGLYFYHPVKHKLELLKKGTFRGDISYLTLAQDAVFNASVSIFFACDFKQLDIFSDRGYRYAHFNIGMASEALYIVATALGLGIRGIGNFFDDELSAFFNLHLPEEYILGGVAIGRY